MFTIDSVPLCALPLHIVETGRSKSNGRGNFLPSPPASQTLGRGLDVLEQVASGPVALTVIAARLGLSRSTVHRLATSLLERRYLNLGSRRGYSLGPKLLELGSIAGEQIGLARAARPIMETLAAATGDAVLLAVRDNEAAVVVDWVPGSRRIAPCMRVGERHDLTGSAAGQALLLGLDEAGWADLADAEHADFLGTMRRVRERGVALDDGVSDPETGTAAAAVRGADGEVRGALALTSAATYREEALGPSACLALRRAAEALSDELGWRDAAIRPESRLDDAQRLDAEHELLNSRRTESHKEGKARRSVADPRGAEADGGQGMKGQDA